MTQLERDSPCKVNLLLNILGRRGDGFHEVETVMHPVPLCDTLRFELTGSSRLELSGTNPDLPADSTNLVWRAASAFLQAANVHTGLKIHLHKRLPLAAGLGGGSGNAATTLLSLNELLDQPLSLNQLSSLAASLGSDVPFFLQNRPALVTGRGEQITPLDWFPSLQPLFILLIHPGFGVSTSWAYRSLAQFPQVLQGRKGRAEELICALRQPSFGQQAALALYNSLEVPVLRKYPILQLYQEFLRENGALATLMSGSGSTTFALAENEAAAQQLKSRFISRFGETPWTAVAPVAPDAGERLG
jgi:4-diphosphocytidyl-2-C-methyl-D-erythritol kinase